MSLNESKPHLIDGGLYVDSRGIVAFVNSFDFEGVDRSYIVRFHCPHEPRGWVGHRRDQKWFWMIEGTGLIALVKPDDWGTPASSLDVERYILSEAKPQVLHVPAGYATGSMSLCADAILMIFSSGKIEDAMTDDYRFAVDTWPIST